MNGFYRKHNKIFYDNITWLLSSDIRIKNGQNKGALYGWKNLDPISYPFIYSEITGYAITSFCWIYSRLGNNSALQAAKESADWIIKNMRSYLLVARSCILDDSDDLSNLFYAFDNGMIMIGLLNLYKLTKDSILLSLAENMTKTIIKRFFDGTKLIARVNDSFKPVINNNKKNNGGVRKWSTVSGAYHCKLAIGLLELSQLTNNKFYAQVSDSICDYALTLQKSNGQFITNPDSDITYLHPHLYSCEGLVYSGLKQSNNDHYKAGLTGIKWAVEMLDANGTYGLAADTKKNSVEQSDCSAQLLRLLILCQSQLRNSLDDSKLDNTIDKLHSRLLDFYIPVGDDIGGMRYHLGLDSACSWCTMFSMQAFALWRIRYSNKLNWMDYFV